MQNLMKLAKEKAGKFEKNSPAREGASEIGSKESKPEVDESKPEVDETSPGEGEETSEEAEKADEGAPKTEEVKDQGQGEEAKRKRGGQQKYKRPEEAPEIYSDQDVCRLLRRNRRSLMLARKKWKRGEDWDCIEHHAGMTREWILKQNPAAKIETIEEWAIKPGDGVVSVEIVQHTKDIQKLVGRRLSDGVTVVVIVNDAANFLDGEQIDVEELGGKYRWKASLNQI